MNVELRHQCTHLLTGLTPISPGLTMQRFFFSVLTIGLVMDALASTILHREAVAVERERDHRYQRQCGPLKVLDITRKLDVLQRTCSCTLGRAALILEVLTGLCPCVPLCSAVC
jgi:hypothetical protein